MIVVQFFGVASFAIVCYTFRLEHFYMFISIFLFYLKVYVGVLFGVLLAAVVAQEIMVSRPASDCIMPLCACFLQCVNE